MSSRTLIATTAVATALTVGGSASASTPPVGSCPSPFVPRTIDEFPPEFVAAVNKNEDNILCIMGFPEQSGQPGANVIDNTAVGL